MFQNIIYNIIIGVPTIFFTIIGITMCKEYYLQKKKKKKKIKKTS